MAKVTTVEGRIGKKYDGMMRRCYNPIDASFKNYGQRGIRVCAAWIKDIREFKKWFLEQLENQNISKEFFLENAANLQIDRINNDGHYTPENCRVTTCQSNVRNRKGIRRQFESAEGDLIDV